MQQLVHCVPVPVFLCDGHALYEIVESFQLYDVNVENQTRGQFNSILVTMAIILGNILLHLHNLQVVFQRRMSESFLDFCHVSQLHILLHPSAIVSNFHPLCRQFLYALENCCKI